MKTLRLTRIHQLWFNEWNVGVEGARREYAEHPSTSICSVPGCFEQVRPRISRSGAAPTRCAGHVAWKRVKR